MKSRTAAAAASIALVLVPAVVRAAEHEPVALIGTGDMGDSLGPRLAALGYRVVYGTRDPDGDRVRELVKRTGHGASAATQVQAARSAALVFLLVPWPAMGSVARNLGDLGGKIVVDISMPFSQGPDGYPQSLLETSSAEMIQGWNPTAKVVKAFAAQGSHVIDEPLSAGGPITVPVASDYRDAKERVSEIAVELGLDPVDFGPLRMARQIEALQMIYMIPFVQQRKAFWEFYFRRNNYWACNPTGESLVPVIDAGNLAEMHSSQDSVEPCP
jgi:8-hydroxy-5-deazaflavin:NADPH oxidoreductase